MTISLMSNRSGSSFGRLSDINYPWIRSQQWDLFYLILSVVLCVVPYTTYYLFGANEVARQVVNGLVAMVIGGPHMYATFNRTVLDADFRRRRRLFVASSLLIPVAVFTLIITQYVAMLTFFFFVASLHALQQLIFINDAYTKKSGVTTTRLARLIDYGVVLAALYPWATYKMMRGDFYIGPVQLWSPLNPGQFLHGQWWIVYSVFAVFYLLLGAFIIKSLDDWRNGHLNVPKTLLVAVTLPLMYFTPLIDNLDTAFQGINVWHSFQYLALTWFILRREEAQNQRARNSLFANFRTAFATTVNWLRARVRGQSIHISPEQSTLMWTAAFYTFQIMMLPLSGLLFIFANVLFPNLPYAEQYSYLMVLPILLVHYCHDAFLFTQPESLVD